MKRIGRPNRWYIRMALPATLFLVTLICGCATTSAGQRPPEKKTDNAQSVTVGGEIQVRGQYLK